MKMITTTAFNKNIKQLQETILKDDIIQTIELILLLNGMVHCSIVAKTERPSLEDHIWDYNDKEAFRGATAKNRYSVAWHLWHSARIEDICSHAFISGTEQVYTKAKYEKRLNIKYRTTGNEFSDGQMNDFNEAIDLKELREYRNAVGAETRKIIKGIGIEKLREKVNQDDVNRVLKEGYIGKGSEWLLDFWGRKKIAGIITMPLTRHILVHLNDCMKILKLKE